VTYYWTQKVNHGAAAMPPTLRPYLDAYRAAGKYQGQTNSAGVPIQFEDAVKHWMYELDVGNTVQFPFGLDPIVVPVPAPIPFPLAKAFPTLGRDGGQWELAVGMQLLGAHGNLTFGVGPYVPASSLLGTRGAK
jgi:hypothetical protein